MTTAGMGKYEYRMTHWTLGSRRLPAPPIQHICMGDTVADPRTQLPRLLTRPTEIRHRSPRLQLGRAEEVGEVVLHILQHIVLPYADLALVH